MNPRRITLVTVLLLASLASATVYAQTPLPVPLLMQHLFGSYDAAQGWSLWSPAHLAKDYESFFADHGGDTSLEYDAFYLEGSSIKRLLVFSTTPSAGGNGCHQCAVLLSAAIFADGSPQPEARNDFLDIAGQNGLAPEMSLQTLSTNHTALAIPTESCHGGLCEGSLSLFAETGSEIRPILQLRSDNDDDNLNLCLHGFQRRHS